jgi:methionyl-tRNA formyltransferase
MKVAFMGNPKFALPSLESLLESKHEVKAIVSNPAKPMGRKRVLKHTDVGSYSLQNNIELIELDSFNNDTIYKKLLSLNVDIFVVVAFRILPEKYISIPKFGSINLHASLLPSYRGAAPIQWALMNGDKTTGVSVFQIEKKVDTGKIITQAKIDIDKNDNYEILSNKLSKVGAGALVEALNNLEEGEVDYNKQDKSLVTKAPKISKEMLRIQWDWPAAKINNWVRGLSPKPGMMAIFQNKRIKIFKTLVIDDKVKGVSGRIKATANSSLEIYTGRGLISILELQQEGKKCLPIEQFLRGTRISDRDFFS